VKRESIITRIPDRRICGERGAALVMACLLFGLASSCVEAGLSNVEGMMGGAIDETAPIEVKHADRLNYDRKNGRMEARGNVVICKGADELRADYVRVIMNTEEADAYGNVVLKRASGVWSGDRVHYNFRTKDADSDRFKIDLAPFHVAAESSQRSVSNQLLPVAGRRVHHLHERVSRRLPLSRRGEGDGRRAGAVFQGLRGGCLSRFHSRDVSAVLVLEPAR